MTKDKPLLKATMTVTQFLNRLEALPPDAEIRMKMLNTAEQSFSIPGIDLCEVSVPLFRTKDGAPPMTEDEEERQEERKWR